MTDKEINLILGKHDLSMVVGKDREQIIAAIRDAVTAERSRFADECIDLVAMYGGSVDLEAAIRARGNHAND